MTRRRFHTPEQERDLVLRAQAGDLGARNALIETNLPLIWKECIRFVRRTGRLSAEELVGVAVEGYVRAIEKFEVERGLRLSTYATNWIRQKIRRHWQDVRSLIRIPVMAQDAYGPRSEEIRAAADRALYGTFSLTNLIRNAKGKGEDEDFDPAQPEPYDPDVSHIPSVEETLAAIATLPERLQHVLELRIDGLTLDQCGQRLGVTRERIRQLETKARALLRKKLRLNANNRREE